MNLEWREVYDWTSFTRLSNSASQWNLVEASDPYAPLGFITRIDERKYEASVAQPRPRPTKTFRSLKQAKAWVQALVLLNQ